MEETLKIHSIQNEFYLANLQLVNLWFIIEIFAIKATK